MEADNSSNTRTVLLSNIQSCMYFNPGVKSQKRWHSPKPIPPTPPHNKSAQRDFAQCASNGPPKPLVGRGIAVFQSAQQPDLK